MTQSISQNDSTHPGAAEVFAPSSSEKVASPPASLCSTIASRLDAYFCISARNSTIGTEFRSGTASFLTLSYLLLVNPQILSAAGLDHSDALFATALSSAVASFVVGVGGNVPFGLAPGLGLSAYLSYGLIQPGLADLSEALTACLASGILLLVCALSGLTDVVIRIVPRSIKLAIVVGMGILIAMIGMVSVDLIVPNPKTLVELGDLSDWKLQVCLLGLILVGALIIHNVKGGILIGIASLTLFFWQVEGTYPKDIVQLPTIQQPINEKISLGSLVDGEIAGVVYPAIGAFLVICIFDISGVIFGLSSLAGLTQDDGQSPPSLWPFLGSVAGTIIAALIGSTPIIVTVECAAGIKEGGRTGLTAVFISLYFLASLFLAPIFSAVPEQATAPILILIGAMMMKDAGKIDWDHMSNALPAFLTIVMMPLTYSITDGMVFGLVTASAFYVTSGEAFRHLRDWFVVISRRGDGGNGGENGVLMADKVNNVDGTSYGAADQA